MRKACRRMNLPVPVALNRFAAALRVFSFGMVWRLGHKQAKYDVSLPFAKSSIEAVP